MEPANPATLPELSPQELRIQRLLKIVVVALAVVILFVLGVIVTTVLSGGRSADRAPEATTAPASEAPGRAAERAQPAAFGEMILPLPRNASITEMAVQAEVLALRYRLPDGSETIAIIGLDTGEVRGHLRVVPSDPQ